MNNINKILVNTLYILKTIIYNHWRNNVRLCNQKPICHDNLHGNKILYINRITIECKIIIISRLYYQIILAFKTTAFN